ncbi:WD40-repeat-containing domain protein [Kockovaella imperatae]|uniref:WD40-repeat-containing domain protein n=1 Tax=Kockovaella imperatae TaxID=4999 RepID=A0A1Y1UJ42_9TREE|nr:WD40-repeat-containing domain protein [Kockovaella imperatae]ORX38002.1 WD40-repeat-containing domain protein [Kockovaella imperatae]
MDSYGLPMSFGKKSKTGPVNLQSKVEKTKRDSAPVAPSPATPVVKVEEDSSPEPGPSVPKAHLTVQPSVAGVEEEGGEEGEQEEQGEDIGPLPPTNGEKRKADGAPEEEVGEENSDEDEDEDDDGDEGDPIPISHEIVLKDHKKVVSAIAVDPSGARIASGSHDYDTKLWDFGGMDARLRPFKTFEANGNYHVHDIDFSPDGQHILVISGTVQPKVFDKNGENEIEFVKGDVYLRDMNHTKGHTAEINGGSWHPTDKNRFLTCSNDSTLRIWDVTDKWKQKQVIVVKSKERGARTRVTACAWSSDGKYIAGACLDGSIHVWDTTKNFARPDRSGENAHGKNTETTGIVFSRDGQRLATRGGDDTVKLWDPRNLRKPLAVASNLANRYPETNLIYSPDGRYILTGVPPASKGEKGAIVFLNAEDLQEERRVPVGEGTVVRILWHSRMNQILATLSTGAIYVLYSPRLSIHGALLPLAKMPRTAPRDLSFSVADLKPVIYAPDALPVFADQKYGESLHQREKRAKKMKPTEPITGVGRGGRVGQSATATMVQALFPNRIDLNEDPREALLKYATKKDEEKKKD